MRTSIVTSDLSGVYSNMLASCKKARLYVTNIVGPDSSVTEFRVYDRMMDPNESSPYVFKSFRQAVDKYNELVG